MLTWDEICRIEPMLLDVLRDAIILGPDPNYTNYEISVSYSDADNRSDTIPQRYGLAWNVSDSDRNDNILWYDLNADGVVNELDFTILVYNMMGSRQSPESYILGDIDSNGLIDVNDAEILVRHKNSKADWLTKAELK